MFFRISTVDMENICTYYFPILSYCAIMRGENAYSIANLIGRITGWDS